MEKAQIQARRDKHSLKRLITSPPNFSLTGAGPDLSLALGGRVSPNASALNHMEATAETKLLELEELNPTIFCKDVLDSPSWLIREQISMSDYDVLSWVENALNDAKMIAKAATQQDLLMRRVTSLFSERHDCLGIFNSAVHAPILMVEVNKPYQPLTWKPRVFGQIYDDLMAMQALNNSAPFAVLTTFEKSIMLWQDNEESNMIAKIKDGRVKDLLKSSSLTLSDNSPNGLKPSIPAEKSTSTDKVRIRINSKSPNNLKPDQESRQNSACKVNSYDVKADRKLLQSAEYDRQEIVRLLYTAIICGLVRNADASRKPLLRPTKDYNGDALKVVEGNDTTYT